MAHRPPPAPTAERIIRDYVQMPEPTCSDGGRGERPGLTEHLDGRRGDCAAIGYNRLLCAERLQPACKIRLGRGRGTGEWDELTWDVDTTQAEAGACAVPSPSRLASPAFASPSTGAMGAGAGGGCVRVGCARSPLWRLKVATRFENQRDKGESARTRPKTKHLRRDQRVVLIWKEIRQNRPL